MTGPPAQGFRPYLLCSPLLLSACSSRSRPQEKKRHKQPLSLLLAVVVETLRREARMSISVAKLDLSAEPLRQVCGSAAHFDVDFSTLLLRLRKIYMDHFS